MEEKGKLLTDISLLLQETRSWANGVMESLDWSKDHLLQKDEVLQQCQFDSNHRMPQEVLQKHERCCPLVKRGFTKDDVEEILNPNCFYDRSKSIIPVHIDVLLERNILRAPHPEQLLAKDVAASNVVTPPSLTKFDTELTPSGRLAIHKYCVARGKQEGLAKIGDDELMMLQEKSKDRDSNKPKSFLERKAELRDQRRHRAKYKTTHTGNKSHKEIIGEVIRNQMEALTELWREEQELEKMETMDEKSNDALSRYSEDARGGETSHRSFRGRSRSPHRNRRSRSRDRHRRKGRYQSRSRSRERRRSRSRSRDRRSSRRSRSRERADGDGSMESRSRRESPESSDSKRHKKHKKDKHKHKHKRSHEKESKESKKQPGPGTEPITDDVLWETSVLS